MGAFLSRSTTTPTDAFVDFESAKPQTPEEERVFVIVAPLVDQMPSIIGRLRGYQGCGEPIKQAITNPSDATTMAAWEAVLPNAYLLRDFFEFSQELQRVVPELLRVLCGSGDAESTLSTFQSLTRQLACIMDFVLRFDDLKINTPPIQNDFSFYRRTLAKMKLQQPDIMVPIKEDLANLMSLFYAYPTPMMKALSDATSTFAKLNTVPRANISECFATMANVCYSMVSQAKFASNETNMFCLRAMTAAVIVFDHSDPLGAFHRKSPVHVRGCVTTLRNYVSERPADTEALLNALRHMTAHLADPETPAAIKQLINAP